MDEARRFMRYVIPGLVALLHYFLLCLLTVPGTWGAIVGAEGGAALVAGLFLASGALGYLFSVIYYWVVWSRVKWSIDHSPALRALVDEGALVVRPPGPTAAPLTHDRLRDVHINWRLGTALWWLNNRNGSPLGSATPRSSGICDVLHGHGAAIVGTVLAGVGWLPTVFLRPIVGSGWPHCLAWGSAVAFLFVSLVVQCGNFLNLRKQSQALINVALASALREGRPSVEQPGAGPESTWSRTGPHVIVLTDE